MKQTCPPLRGLFGARLEPYFALVNVSRKRWLIFAGLGLFGAASGLGFAYEKQAEEAANLGPLLLLLSTKMALFTHETCTTVSNAVTQAGHLTAPVLAWVLLAVALVDLLRNIVQKSRDIDELKAQVYSLVVDQFEDCRRCAHMNICPKSTYETMQESARRCSHDLGVDLLALQRVASRSLGRARAQGIPEPVAAPETPVEAVA